MSESVIVHTRVVGRVALRGFVPAMLAAMLGGCVFPDEFAVDDDPELLEVSDGDTASDAAELPEPDADTADLTAPDADTASEVDVAPDTTAPPDTVSDADALEPCGGTCGASTVCCTRDGASSCVDLDESVVHCGACDLACAPEQLCVEGECVDPPCAEGLERCEGVCTDLADSDAHCGACRVACAEGLDCDGGTCVCPATGAGATTRACTTSETCCVDAGCADTETSPRHCGGCGLACRPGERCVGGTCVCGEGDMPLSCADGEVCCDGACTGPEACQCGSDPGTVCLSDELCCGEPGLEACVGASSLEHCGACGVACHGDTQRCDAGACVCLPDRADCDGDPSNGCEVDLLSDTGHCGACERTCAVDAVCSAGQCLCGSTPCGAGRTCCGGTQCVVVESNVDHCGACNMPCPGAGTNVSSVFCAESACQTACEPGFGNCDGLFGNGCETALSSLTNCGACGALCKHPIGLPCSCANGTCGGTGGCAIQ